MEAEEDNEPSPYARPLERGLTERRDLFTLSKTSLVFKKLRKTKSRANVSAALTSHRSGPMIKIKSRSSPHSVVMRQYYRIEFSSMNSLRSTRL